MSEKKPLCLYGGQVKELQTGDTVVGAQSSTGTASAGINHIINGNFDIWQRGTSQTATGYGSDDRWFNGTSVATKTHSRQNCTDTERALFNAAYYSRTVVTTASNSAEMIIKLQKIEDVTRLAGKTVTLSFWARADSAKNIGLEFRQNFGTGGTPSANLDSIGTQLIALTSTWEKKTITVDIPSIAGKTLGTDGVHTSALWLTLWFTAGSAFDSRSGGVGTQSGTFDIAQVQLEAGSAATDFQLRHPANEMALCQRYYEASDSPVGTGTLFSGYTVTQNNYYASCRFQVKKRVIPTIILSTIINSGFETTRVVLYSSTDAFVESRKSIITAAMSHYVSAFTADAEL